MRYQSLRRSPVLAMVWRAVLTLVITSSIMSAQIRVNPTGVSVNAMNPSTVFLTFGGVLTNMRATEAFWCGELVSAAPDRGSRCTSSSIFGSLPARYDLSRSGGLFGFTDIMSIPASVTRRAYQDARNGAVSSFFYVRKFENLNGGPDEYVAVTCRLTGGQAQAPFALTDVRVSFEAGDEVQFLRTGEAPPPFTAQITHNGTGRLIGRWEVVMPGEEVPTPEDLLTEATLPLERRASQRHYAQVQRFNLFVPPGGKVQLTGPDPARLPTSAEGQYLVLLRIEASDDREGDSNLDAVGAGAGTVHSGAVAGFPMPVLRYVVVGDGAVSARNGISRLGLVAPLDGGGSRADSSFRLSWRGDQGARAYRIELQSVDYRPVHSAIVPAGVTHYESPNLVWSRANGTTIRWRVTALDDAGKSVRQTGWRRVVIRATSASVSIDSSVRRP